MLLALRAVELGFGFGFTSSWPFYDRWRTVVGGETAGNLFISNCWRSFTFVAVRSNEQRAEGEQSSGNYLKLNKAATKGATKLNYTKLDLTKLKLDSETCKADLMSQTGSANARLRPNNKPLEASAFNRSSRFVEATKCGLQIW